jgi:Ca2+-binding RTX toxin-like protein
MAAMAATAATATSAEAVHWPFFGGDNGRSGYQPVGEGVAPVKFRYSKTAASDQFLKTSVLTSAGVPATQRVIYGTVNPQEVTAGAAANANGRVHQRVLADGAAVGPQEGVKIDDGQADGDVFGPGAAAPAPSSVSFVDTSSASGLGQVFAVHNDDDQSPTGDIAVAQVDEATGGLVKDVPLTGTADFSILSSPVTTGPDSAGNRVLFFVAQNGDDQRLFRVPIANAGSAAAAFGTVTSTGDIDADPQASPTIAFLRAPDGSPAGYVAVGTAANLRTFSIANLAAGPQSPPLGGSVQTPSVPIQPNGMTPNPATDVKTAPSIYAAVQVGGSTQVRKLVQNANEQALTVAASSPALPGPPAPALATDQQSRDKLAPGKLIVTTGANLYVLGTEDLQPDGAFSDTPLAAGTSGFSQTTAAASGELIYVTNDEGAQLVLRLSDGAAVEAEAFSENAANKGDRLDRSGMGQPSISRSFVQFGSQKGLFVYSNACGNELTGTKGAENRLDGTAAGDEIALLAGADRSSAGDGDDCVDGGPGDDGVSGNAGEDLVQGKAGKDRVFGRAGDDRLSGNADDDRVVGNKGDDRVFGRSGNDGLSGGAGADLIRGGGGGDRIFGRGGDDRISGNAGDDRIQANGGRDRVFGRQGDDRIRVRDGVREVIDCGSGNDTVAADRLDVLRNCERVFRR